MAIASMHPCCPAHAPVDAEENWPMAAEAKLLATKK